MTSIHLPFRPLLHTSVYGGEKGHFNIFFIKDDFSVVRERIYDVRKTDDMLFYRTKSQCGSSGGIITFIPQSHPDRFPTAIALHTGKLVRNGMRFAYLIHNGTGSSNHCKD